MPLRITSASSRGNKIKNIFIRIGSIFVVLLVICTCLIPLTTASAANLNTDIVYGGFNTTIGKALASVEPTSSTKAEEAVQEIMGGSYNSGKSTYTLSAQEVYDAEDDHWTWFHICDIFYERYYELTGGDPDNWWTGVTPLLGWENTEVGVLLTEFNGWFTGFSQLFVNTYSKLSATEKDQILKVSQEAHVDGFFTYYDIIVGSERLASNASVDSIIDLGRSEYFSVESGVTLKKITSETDAAFKALMVGAVASSYAGAINSVTNATDTAEALLSESFSGQISGWSWDSESKERYDFHDSDGNPISQVNVSSDGSTYTSITGIIYQVCKDISYSVILPVAGIILAFVFAWQIYEAVCERNNMADMGTGFFIQMIVRMVIMIMIVLAAWTLTEWVFSLGQWIVNQTSVVVYENFTEGSMMQTIYNNVTDQYSADDILTWVLAYKICVNDAIDFGGTLVMLVQGLIINIGMYVVSLIVYVIVYVRLIEMYIQCALAPIPLATMANRTWNQTALNFIRSVFALALQGFIIFLCLEIFNVLINNVMENGLSEADFTGAMWEVIGFALILVFCLFKSSSLSKSIVDAR